MKRCLLLGCLLLFVFGFCVNSALAAEQSPPISEATQSCLDCHSEATPGIVAGWEKSAHARTTVARGLKRPELEQRVSAGDKAPEEFKNFAVGCAECHIGTVEHPDAFQHDEFMVHTVVSPRDCAQCHPKEVSQYAENIMSQAHGNLMNNPVYLDLVKQVAGRFKFKPSGLAHTPPLDMDLADSCLYCHGAKVEQKGVRKVVTDLGEFEFPVWSNWPNHGVGRINPDKSKGSCAACHSRHTFSIEMARKPATCSECHKGPDVPAYKVYEVSKHGNLYKSLGHKWNFKSVPWVAGKDYNAPTCAACHISLVTDPAGNVVAKRTHRMNDRLGNRLLGLIYAHSHPKSPDTSIIKNADNLPLPTTLSGQEAEKFLIGEKEKQKRREAMSGICLSCHASGWVEGHFARLDNTIDYTNQMVKASTQTLAKAWEKGQVKGLDQKDSMFNESLERLWAGQWLIYANNIRLAAAMAGADYGTFADGRWQLSNRLLEMQKRLDQGSTKK
ncbi:multiheme c-type cytochrome [Dethiosulfatarculus sandiegensis]|uniref:Hydroxylamine oxidase n=1 Tax=Dethiosulfatarculus sandiegensis TaxID=1429043 RepID=A0A0D2GFE7_9BACT|nr:multiheme c-type cytochrome [Dethiosulfatarculus sandiegensis]KIX13662.1 hydroxylamine oxidase [Dethiosulfatarculus sandiegensis]